MSTVAPQPEDRHISQYSTRERAGRMLWSLVQATVFRCSFHTWNRWRIMLLNRFGADVDRTCVVRRTVRVECPWHLTMGANSCLGDRAVAYCLGPITIGRRVSISQHVHLCAGSHDHSRADMPLLRPPIDIEDDVWVAADAFVGPNVRIGQGAILGARGVAMKSLKPWTIYAGNPARSVRDRPPLKSV